MLLLSDVYIDIDNVRGENGAEYAEQQSSSNADRMRRGDETTETTLIIPRYVHT